MATAPFSAYQQFPGEALAGRIVIDTMNHYSQRDGRMADVETGEFTTGEHVQRNLNTLPCGQGLPSLDYRRLFASVRASWRRRPQGLAHCGDDAAAKAEVARIMDAIGYDAVDLGTLADSWRCEPGTPVYAWPYVGASRRE